MQITQNITEFEVQSFLYENLRERGCEVRGEWPLSDQKNPMRIDLMVFQDSCPILAIEVKRQPVHLYAGKSRSEIYAQCKRYQSILECPLVLIDGMTKAVEFLVDYPNVDGWVYDEDVLRNIVNRKRKRREPRPILSKQMMPGPQPLPVDLCFGSVRQALAKIDAQRINFR